jgi:hypothetical protein
MANALGTATIDFGAAPGTAEASVVVTGQATISVTSLCEAWIMSDVTTADNDAAAHEALAWAASPPVCKTRVAGTGFTIWVRLLAGRATGQYKVQWVWSD